VPCLITTIIDLWSNKRKCIFSTKNIWWKWS